MSPPRFERNGATARFADNGARVTLTVCTPRIVRVELEDDVHTAGPSYVGERSWPAVPFQMLDGEPVRLTTPDLTVEIGTGPLRLAFLDSSGEWLLREPEHEGMRSEPAAGDPARCRIRAAF